MAISRFFYFLFFSYLFILYWNTTYNRYSLGFIHSVANVINFNCVLLALISTLYEGDVIARIAGADSALWDSHSAESLFSIQSCVPIEVIADNAFRFATTSSLAVDDLQTRYGIISVDFVQAGKIGQLLYK